MNDLKIAFFGTPDIAVWVLEELEVAGIIPELIVTNPDRPQGRKMLMTSPPVKAWAVEHNIGVLQPENLNRELIVQHLVLNNGEKTCLSDFDLFVVVAYGLIMPKWLIDLPKHKTLNVHPSLLPKLRGASPIRSAILNDIRETGVTIMQMDEKMDHGPIVGQMKTEIAPENWPVRGRELDENLARLGGSLLASLIPAWVAGKIEPLEQDHAQATFCKKITKADGELHIDPYNLPTGDEAYQTLLKIYAYDGWPGTFFRHEDKRIKVTEAELAASGEFRIIKVIPEGKKEMGFRAYLQR